MHACVHLCRSVAAIAPTHIRTSMLPAPTNTTRKHRRRWLVTLAWSSAFCVTIMSSNRLAISWRTRRHLNELVGSRTWNAPSASVPGSSPSDPPLMRRHINSSRTTLPTKSRSSAREMMISDWASGMAVSLGSTEHGVRDMETETETARERERHTHTQHNNTTL